MIRIKENSLLARLAARYLKSDAAAIVIGHTIHLWNVSKQDFLKSRRWLRHEVAHIQQFHRYGFIRFLILYFLETMKNGYEQNKFEVEARVKENDTEILNGIALPKP